MALFYTLLVHPNLNIGFANELTNILLGFVFEQYFFPGKA